MNTIIPMDLESAFLLFADESGLSDFMSPEELRSGIADLKVELLRIAAELIEVHHRGESLAHAVFDDWNYPKLTRLHGFWRDMMVADLPAEMIVWVERAMATPPPPMAVELRRWLVHVSLHEEQLPHRLLAQWALFEGLCMNERVALRRAGGHLEGLNGQRSDIEKIAEVEVATLLASPDYAQALLEVEDPWAVLVGSAMKTLEDHADELAQNVALLSAEFRRRLEIRQQALWSLDGLPASDAVLIRNAHAEAFGEERLSVEQLQVRHSVLIGDVKRNTLDKRLQRLKKQRFPRMYGPPPPPTRTMMGAILRADEESSQ